MKYNCPAFWCVVESFPLIQRKRQIWLWFWWNCKEIKRQSVWWLWRGELLTNELLIDAIHLLFIFFLGFRNLAKMTLLGAGLIWILELCRSAKMVREKERERERVHYLKYTGCSLVQASHMIRHLTYHLTKRERHSLQLSFWRWDCLVSSCQTIWGLTFIRMQRWGLTLVMHNWSICLQATMHWPRLTNSSPSKVGKEYNTFQHHTSPSLPPSLSSVNSSFIQC